MVEAIENANVEALRLLDSPGRVKGARPLGRDAAEVVARGRREVRDVLHGRDGRRLVVVVGPCSIHDPEAALDYARRLRPLIDEHAGELVIAMRTYFEKPRTTVGWKGYLNDPHLDGSCNVAEGIARARELLLAILALGVPCATELLDPVTPQYLADLISWGAIGARTTESQTHREMASGLSMPVGFKNGTDGSLESAVNAMTSARHSHSFLGLDSEGRAAVVYTRGNPDRHVVLRGGRSGTNFDAGAVARAVELAAPEGVPRCVMVDCSHDNSGKDHTRQSDVCRAALDQVVAGQRAIMGLLIESHLESGSQAWTPGAALRYGVSITDACIGFDETEELLAQAAAAVRCASPRGTGARDLARAS